MSSSASQPYKWIKQLPSSLLQLDEEVSTIGLSPPFPWETFSDKLRELFKLDHLEIHPQEWQTKPFKELCAGLGTPLIKQLKIQPLESSAYFILPRESLPLFIKEVMQSSSHDDYEDSFQTAFFQFLTVEILNTLSSVSFDPGLSYHILPEEEPSSEPLLCLTLDIVLKQHTLHSYLVISPDLNHAWKERYSDQQVDLMLQSPLADKIPITVHLEAGKVELTQQNLTELQIGDFIILDTCSMDPVQGKGRVMLTVNDRPFMRGKLKDGQLKILETPHT